MKNNGTESKTRTSRDSTAKTSTKKGASSTAHTSKAAEESTELFKYRLLGAVVTFVLLALFGPELLDGSGRVYTAEIIDIPEPPELPTPPLLKPPSPLGTGFQSESSDHNVTSVKPKAQLSELKIKEAAKTPEKVDTASKSSTTLPKKATSLATRKPAWTLQLATFSQPKNAYALRERLTKDGFNSYSRLIKDSSGSTRYQVYVGPEISKEKMLIVKKQLAKKLKLKDGIIKPYVP